MNVLIVESDPNLAWIWTRHLERQGAKVQTAPSADAAVDRLGVDPVDVIVLNLILEGGGAFAVADFASYRRPDAKVIFVTNSSFFSDGSIFHHIPNACAFVGTDTAPEDLAAMVDHYGT